MENRLNIPVLLNALSEGGTQEDESLCCMDDTLSIRGRIGRQIRQFVNSEM